MSSEFSRRRREATHAQYTTWPRYTTWAGNQDVNSRANYCKQKIGGQIVLINGWHKKKVIVVRRKEGNVLFNDALNTFYLRLYGVRPSKRLVAKLSLLLGGIKSHCCSKEGNVLFNDALNTFYLLLYGVRPSKRLVAKLS